MDKLTGDDDLNEIVLLENTSSELNNEHDCPYIPTVKDGSVCTSEVFTKDPTLQRKSKYQEENVSLECNIDDCNSLLNFNKQIISFLIDVKKHITYALQKCEKKLTIIETNLQKHTTGDTKALICNAGMPYFKDRYYFSAPNNDDEILKENYKELHLRNLPKVIPWTIKERNTLLKAVQEEATASSIKIEHIRFESTCKSTWKINKETKTGRRSSANDSVEVASSLQDRDFDWFKISSIYFEDVHSPLDCRVMWNVFLHPEINKSCWSKSEDVKLKEITKQHKFQNWDNIAEELNTNRSAYQCFIRYNTIRKLPKIRNCIWEHREDDRLLKLVKIFQIGNFIPWGEVASWMPNRTKQQAYFRWTYSLTPYLTKGRFSKSEDNLLKDAVTKYGTNFRKISAALMPNRSTVQLHDRYQTLTSNQIENWNVWSLAEDSKLLELFECFGPNWSKISKAFTCKTRTRLRHRHAALQKYLSKGISVFDLHTDYSKRKNKEAEQEKKNEKSDQIQFNLNKDVSNSSCNNDIDKELIEYFHKEQTIERSFNHRQKLYKTDEPKFSAKELYDILRVLNVKFHMPDEINNSKLDDRHKQLFYSLKEYINVRDDKKRQHAVIDKCSSLMFGVNHIVKKGTGDVLSESFESQVKLKYPNKTQCIDYHMNTKNAFLVEKTAVFNTPDFMISHIGGNEQELQFEKLARLFIMDTCCKDKHYTRNMKNSNAFPCGMSLDPHNNGNSDNRKKLVHNESKEVSIVPSNTCSDISLVQSNLGDRVNYSTLQSENCEKFRDFTTKNNTLFNVFEKIQEFTPNSTVDTSKIQYSSVIETAHATLLGFKHLIYLKQLNKECNDPREFCMISKGCQRSLNILITRLEQLFRYPIGLSKTTLPKVYVMDTFSYDDVTSKRKATETPTILKPYKIGKFRSYDKNSRKI
ncbi:proximal sequence element A Pbp95 [Nomia melanderi]|uniref:proximal sequence element A Pbp95 n=1 Tax=Nomia melanderi TaxID=2448451 RepID=UPI001304043E|nr:snRNA-activating protein complex subunit 4 homolog [Nomia melanderi]XP_031845133.1 snRNA-activating protein complex subunit 4 homolog [Nomia melanderi]XP_031845134.1 snRNA-activating protein complex subunit 4 homolog [Nomia melanderi]XP_031845135.1 snRNA-activating protein complex subunit 4 homolog [Nomia melanderi]XP_031845136.1 snRNA-activating protein complex subunit 4 homolog [Nomia melanderi]XP_031845137.1 snRNA-activating protein complex subunit 4 homolog [Nomia melanderi]